MAADNGKRVGVVALTVSNRREQAAAVNALLSDFGHLVVGRMGIPYKERGIHLIALLVDGDTDALGAMAGKLGSLSGVRVRTLLLTDDIAERLPPQ